LRFIFSLANSIARPARKLHLAEFAVDARAPDAVPDRRFVQSVHASPSTFDSIARRNDFRNNVRKTLDNTAGLC
jgi:hypothetical protein